jgi:hypothetical protein
MMHDDSVDAQPRDEITNTIQSTSPSRRHYLHNDGAIIQETPQMHSLDYTNQNDDDVYYKDYRHNNNNSRNKNHHQQQQQQQELQRSDIVNPPSSALNNDIRINKNKSWLSFVWATRNNKSNIIKNDTGSSLVITGTNDDSNSDQYYNDIDVESNNNNMNETVIVPGSPKRRPRNYNSSLHQPLQSIHSILPTNQLSNGVYNQTTEGDNHTLESNTEYLSLHNPTTTNDHTGETDDCSFFFRPLESDMIRKNRHVQRISSHRNNQSHTHQQQHEWKVIRRDHHKRQGESVLYEYNDAVPVTPIPILQHYRTKFAQLNSELITESSSQYNRDRYLQHLEQLRDPFDDWYILQQQQQQQSSLQLQEHDANNHGEIPVDSYYNASIAIPSGGHNLQQQQSIAIRQHSNGCHGIVRSDTARQSSLFFRANGRILMRLPRDRVRLLVDPDLEVGILSVEQWRTIESDDEESKYEIEINKPPMTESLSMIQEESKLPELRYVLTVSDDLYRKIIEEMSPTTTKYFCCTRGCCNEEEKVDIRIAYVLFGAMLLMLFINMLAFREH